MKTAIRTILCAAAVVLAAVSCQKSIEPSNPDEEGKGTIDICVKGLLGEYTLGDGTKADLVNTVRASWKGGETVYVYDDKNYLGKLKVSLEGTDRYALLSTDDDHKVGTPRGSKLTLVYSPLSLSFYESKILISLGTQTGEKAPFVAYATLDYSGDGMPSITNTVVPFQFATSVIKVNCTGLEAGTAINSVKLSNVNTVCILNVFKDDDPSVSADMIGDITITGNEYFAAEKVNGEGEAVFQIAVPVLGESSEARVLTVTQNSDQFKKDKNFTTSSLLAAQSVNTVSQLVGWHPLDGEFTVNDNNKKVRFSTGNLWADSDNLLHFETNQYAFNDQGGSSHISHFTWADDIRIAVGDNKSGNNLFCDENHKVSVDGSGKIYYALSDDEWAYLFNHHVTKWASVKGVSGYVIAPDGYQMSLATSYADDVALAEHNLVFLPATMYNKKSGYYWTTTFYTANNGYFIRFSSEDGFKSHLADNDAKICIRLVTDVAE